MNCASLFFVFCCFSGLTPFVQGTAGVPIGIKAGLYADIVSNKDFVMNLRPPVEETEEAQKSLDALHQLEKYKFDVKNADDASKQERMLNIEKKKIRDIVHARFAPLLTKIGKD